MFQKSEYNDNLTPRFADVVIVIWESPPGIEMVLTWLDDALPPLNIGMFDNGSSTMWTITNKNVYNTLTDKEFSTNEIINQLR